MRYSRKQNDSGKELYIATTLVLVAELIKFSFCLMLLLAQKAGSLSATWKTLLSEVVCTVLTFIIFKWLIDFNIHYFSLQLLKPWETAKLAIPSSLYCIQNNLILLALSYLDAATFQVKIQYLLTVTQSASAPADTTWFFIYFSLKVTYQLKILTTAFFSVLLLRKELKALQWLALVILMSGVILVQVHTII